VSVPPSHGLARARPADAGAGLRGVPQGDWRPPVPAWCVAGGAAGPSREAPAWSRSSRRWRASSSALACPPRATRRRLSRAAGRHRAQRGALGGPPTDASKHCEDTPGPPRACPGGVVGRSPVRRGPVCVSGVGARRSRQGQARRRERRPGRRGRGAQRGRTRACSRRRGARFVVVRRARYRSPAQLRPGVDMTSDVKSREQLCLRLHPFFL
jgi:hypothetical protein